MTQVSPSHVITLLSLRKGDSIMVKTDRLRKPRVLTVLDKPTRNPSGSIMVFVTSGRVRPGHRDGGALTYREEPEELTYQPTLLQKIQDVTDLKKISEAQAERVLMASGEIAKTILEQMGGRRLGMMLGVKRFIALPRGLAFQWPNRQRTNGNYVEITLTPRDTYDMEFFNLSTRAKKPVKKYRDVYAEDLTNIFERQTGWYTRMASKTAAVSPGEMTEYVSLLDKAYRMAQRWDLPPELDKVFVDGLYRFKVIAEKNAPKAFQAVSAQPFQGVRKGDILAGDAGATMTLPVFYEVLKDTPVGKMVPLRQLESTLQSSGGNAFTGKKMPVLGRYRGQPVRRKLGWYQNEPFTKVGNAYLRPWDGKPRYYDSLD